MGKAEDTLAAILRTARDNAPIGRKDGTAGDIVGDGDADREEISRKERVPVQVRARDNNNSRRAPSPWWRRRKFGDGSTRRATADTFAGRLRATWQMRVMRGFRRIWFASTGFVEQT